jgi:hypothetical protein
MMTSNGDLLFKLMQLRIALEAIEILIKSGKLSEADLHYAFDQVDTRKLAAELGDDPETKDFVESTIVRALFESLGKGIPDGSTPKR